MEEEMMKKWTSLLIISALLVSVLCGCAAPTKAGNEPVHQEPVYV